VLKDHKDRTMSIYSKLLEIVEEENKKRKILESDKQTSIISNQVSDKEKTSFQGVKKEELSASNTAGYSDLGPSYSRNNSKSSSSSHCFDYELFKSNLVSILREQKRRQLSYTKTHNSVSEVVGCLRSAYFMRKKYPLEEKQEDPFLVFDQEIGTFIHSLFYKHYQFLETEKSFKSDTYMLKGRVDAITESTLFDIKTGLPSKKDFDQVQTYACVLNLEHGYSICNVEVIYYKPKDRFVQFETFPYDQKVGEIFLSRSLKLLEYLSKSIIPPPEYERESCYFCSFQNLCKSCLEDLPESKITNLLASKSY
jgi:CRISPR/Cas system-associated exonuclease Cas4 (RecB family)